MQVFSFTVVQNKACPTVLNIDRTSSNQTYPPKIRRYRTKWTRPQYLMVMATPFCLKNTQEMCFVFPYFFFSFGFVRLHFQSLSTFWGYWNTPPNSSFLLVLDSQQRAERRLKLLRRVTYTHLSPVKLDSLNNYCHRSQVPHYNKSFGNL